MNNRDLQAQIDQIKWYHEFDFGNGLLAKSSMKNAVAGHRRIWNFIEHELSSVDFRGKRVLDVGCWDGYWSFFAERRGAASVLASDDLSQNHSIGNGLQLAKDLLGSDVEINQDVSIYELTKLNRKFDIILCLGVYYHLHSPFYGFAQLRHCCHDETIVVLDGDVAPHLSSDECRFSWAKPPQSEFVPAPGLLHEMLTASYFNIERSQCISDFVTNRQPVMRLYHWLNSVRGRLKAHLPGLRQKPAKDRNLLVCTPFRGVNKLHFYRPPFGLDQYDDRFTRHASSDAA